MHQLFLNFCSGMLEKGYGTVLLEQAAKLLWLKLLQLPDEQVTILLVLNLRLAKATLA